MPHKWLQGSLKGHLWQHLTVTEEGKEESRVEAVGEASNSLEVERPTGPKDTD